jgi:hypothetical protein
MAELHGASPRDCCRCGSHDAHGESAEQGCLGRNRTPKAKRKYSLGCIDSPLLGSLGEAKELDAACCWGKEITNASKHCYA